MQARTILLALSAVVILTHSHPARAQSPQAPPIIDMHMHAVTIASWGFPQGETVPLLSFPHGFTRQYSAARSDAEVFQQTLETMDKHNIVLGFISGELDDLFRWMDGFDGSAPAPTERFLPSPMLGHRPDALPDVEHLRQLIASGRLRAIGELTSQYGGLAPTDPRMEPYYALAEEMDVPVLIHCLGIGAPIPTFRAKLGNPLLLEDVLVRHPKLRLWVENAGWPFRDEFVSLMYQYPRVYADLSTISWIIPREEFHAYLESLMRAGLGKRLMFGSDLMIWPETITMAVEAIDSADFLTEEEKRDIFYHNARRFLRLP